jgi:hypothetical protein
LAREDSSSAATESIRGVRWTASATLWGPDAALRREGEVCCTLSLVAGSMPGAGAGCVLFIAHEDINGMFREPGPFKLLPDLARTIAVVTSRRE